MDDRPTFTDPLSSVCRREETSKLRVGDIRPELDVYNHFKWARMQLSKRTGPTLVGLSVVIYSLAAANSQSAEKPPGTARSLQDGQYVLMPFESRTESQVLQNNPHEPAQSPLLIVRERLETRATFNCRAGLIGSGFSYSELPVFDNGQVQKARMVSRRRQTR